jgi:hypothetical protein
LKTKLLSRVSRKMPPKLLERVMLLKCEGVL